MAAAALAHGGLGGNGHLQIGAALETSDFALFDRSFFWGYRGGFFRGLLYFIQTKVRAACLADRGIRADRLPLRVAALGTRDRGRLWFGRRHTGGYAT